MTTARRNDMPARRFELASERTREARLVEFFYLLTRDAMAFGDVKQILRKMAPVGSDNRYCSVSGEQLAREIVHELLTGEKPWRETEAAASIAEDRLADFSAEPGPQ